jgi:hypothetical protein
MAPIMRTVRPTLWFYIVAFIELAGCVALSVVYYPKMNESLGFIMYLLFLCASACIALVLALTRFPQQFGIFYAIFFRLEVDGAATSENRDEESGGEEARPAAPTPPLPPASIAIGGSAWL